MEGGQRQRGEDKKSKVANVCGGGEGGQDGRGELNEVWTPGLPTEAGPADSTTEGDLHGNGGEVTVDGEDPQRGDDRVAAHQGDRVGWGREDSGTWRGGGGGPPGGGERRGGA